MRNEAETMQFGSYIFPHNPHTITVSQPQALETHLCPGRGEILQNLGARSRTVRCQGAFFGGTYAQALAKLVAFRRACQGDEARILLAPGLEPFMARLRELTFDASGDGRVIPYTAVFLECREVAG